MERFEQQLEMSSGLTNKIKHFLEDPEYRVCKILLHHVDSDRIPDRLFLKHQFHYVFGYPLNLKNPQTYNEKLQWLKLYDHNPLYTTLVDKHAAKKWVAERIGEQYIIPTLAVYDNTEQIDLSKLPDRFVLKCTHDSGSVVICKNRETFDFESAKRVLDNGLKNNFYKKHREWPYKNIRPRIIAEKYKEDLITGELRDYKFFCFDGIVKAMFVGTERQKQGKDVKFDFFDDNYNHLPFKQGHEHAAVMPAKPESFEQMKELASQLSKGIPHVRVDLYEVDGKPFFGEMTFYHFSGMVSFNPKEWDYFFGKWIKLPAKKRR